MGTLTYMNEERAGTRPAPTKIFLEYLSMKNNWQTKKIGEVCEVIAGQSPEGKFYNKIGKGLPFYQGKKDFGKKFIQEPTTWTTNITKEAQKNDILMSVRAPVGPINFATQKICIGRGLAAIRAGENFDKDYLFYFLSYKEDAIKGSAGAVFASINKNEIESLVVPHPSFSEQKRIVETLDEVFEKIEKVRNNAERNLQNSRELFESYLQSVFANHDKNWAKNELKEITTKIGSGATPRGGENDYKEVGISLVRSMNVYDQGFRDKKLAFLDDNQADKLSNVTLEKDDVLLNITGASIARCCIIPKEVLPARVNQHVSIIRLRKEKMVPKFLHYVLISKKYKDRLLHTGEKGGSTRQAITKAQIERFMIKYPESLSKQKSIVKKLDGLSEQTKMLEEIYKKKLADLEELKKSVLKQAFEGKL